MNICGLFKEFLDTAKKPGNQTAIFDRCAGIFLSIVQHISNHIRDENVQKTLLYTLKHMIDNRTDFNYTLDSLISELYCTKSHAMRTFKAEFNITPYQYILSKKITQAEILLTNTNIPIRDISEILNFNNTNYFSSFFKEQIAMAPSTYRKIRKNKIRNCRIIS